MRHLLYPSLREGFGILAMSCNVQLHQTHHQCLVSGGAHIINLIQKKLPKALEILNNETYRKSLCRKGLERSKESLGTICEDYLKLYELIHSEYSKKNSL
jgi:hypothetical protein